MHRERKAPQASPFSPHWPATGISRLPISPPTDGYLIGTRFNASRALLLQSGDTLVIRAKADSLPGFKTPEKITAVEIQLTPYRGHTGDQQQSTKEKELARLDRDELLHVLNTRRSVIPHAADAV